MEAVAGREEVTSLSHAFVEAARGVLSDGVHTDPLTRKLYATDASVYEIEPFGVAYPRSKEELAALMRLAYEYQIPVIVRGGGTGLAGETLGKALILDCSRFMNRIVEISPDKSWVRAECGVVLDELNRTLAPLGRRIGPDPASGSRCVLGGMIANNSTGAHSLYYGHIREHILELECVLSNGELVTFRPLLLDGPDYQEITSRDTLEANIYRQTRRLCETHAELIEEKWPHHLKRHRSGYLLHKVVDGGQIDLTKLIAGSEGTLAIVTEVKLRTVEIPKCRALLLLHFGDILSATRAVCAILAHAPYSLELLDQNVISLARGAGFGYEKYLPEAVNSILYTEFEGESSEQVEQKVRQCIDDVVHAKGLCAGYDTALDAEKMNVLWRIRKSGEPLLHRRKGHGHPTGFIEDAAVAPERLTDYVAGKEAIFAKYGVQYATHAHAGAGVLHTRPFLDLKDPADCLKMEKIAEETYDLLISLGGSISGEHGDGLCRTQFLIKQFGARLYGLFHEVKDVFDPRHLLNMGKIVYNTEPHLIRKNLRTGESYHHRRVLHHLAWTAGELEAESEKCHGCAECRTLDRRTLSMCPVYRAVGLEAATPRAKANLMRLLGGGRLEAGWVASEEFKRIADTCVNCKACQLECSVKVNVPMMMMEAKAEWVSRHGQSLTNTLLVSAERLSQLACLAAPLANWGARVEKLRAVGEKLTGIDRRRTLPGFSSRPFLSRAKERYTPQQPNGRKVVYFVDLYANYNDPQLAEAFVAVMTHNGVEVVVPRDQRGCQMPAMDYGSADVARRAIIHNAALLRPWIEAGYEVVTAEPSAALALKEEYRYFVDSEDVRLLSEHTREATDYLRELESEGLLRRDFSHPLEKTFGYHVPCHLKALRVGTPGAELVRLVPGVKVKAIRQGCCGIAGTFGMKKEGYDISMSIGAGLFAELAGEGIDAGLSECSTCKMQMEHGSQKPTFHPLKVLAHGYGLSRVDG